MFKIGMSLVLAVIAAFVIILAGFLSEVRFGTMLLRGLLGFVVTGVIGALFVTFFEAQNAKTLEEDSSRNRDEDEEMSYIPENDEESGGETPEEESAGFQPLEDQDLEHVRPPEG